MIKGDIVLIPFPFTDLSGKKLRPALVLAQTESDVTVCFITSKTQFREETDIAIEPSLINGIKKSSVIRVHKIATLDKNLVIGLLGKSDVNLLNKVDESLKNIFQLS